MARTPAPGTRERILDSADRLFYEKGVHAVGLQEVVDDCGCGKNLLYREFATKDELVVAYLGRCRDAWTAMIEAATAPFPDDPGAQLVAIVRTTVEHATAPGYRGCPVHNTHAEFPEAAHPAGHPEAESPTSAGSHPWPNQRRREYASHARARDRCPAGSPSIHTSCRASS